MCLGIPGRVVEITSEDPPAGIVDVSGVRRRVDLSCTVTSEGVAALVGKWVLVHVGFAMSVIDENEAARTLAALEELGETMEEIEAMHRSAAMLEGTE